jgi:hypothetical protein
MMIKSFLHAYFRIVCREMTGTEQTNHLLRRMVLSPAHFIAGQHPVLFYVGGGTWKQANLCGGPNDYLITD